jgi:hypothetical protein
MRRKRDEVCGFLVTIIGRLIPSSLFLLAVCSATSPAVAAAPAGPPAKALRIAAGGPVGLDLGVGRALNQSLLEAPGGDLGLRGTHRGSASRRERGLSAAWAPDGERVALNGADLRLRAFDGKLSAQSRIAVGETESAAAADRGAMPQPTLGNGPQGREEGSATETSLQTSLPLGGGRSAQAWLTRARLQPGVLADAPAAVTDRELFRAGGWLRGEIFSFGARDELDGNNASRSADGHGVRRHRRRADAEIKLRPLLGEPFARLGSLAPTTFQFWGEIESWETKSAGDGGIEPTEALVGLARPDRRQERLEAALLWPSGLRLSFRRTAELDPRLRTAPAAIFDDIEVARGFVGAGWSCGLRAAATVREDGERYGALRVAGDVALSGWQGLVFRGLAATQAEAWEGGSR